MGLHGGWNPPWGGALAFSFRSSSSSLRKAVVNIEQSLRKDDFRSPMMHVPKRPPTTATRTTRVASSILGDDDDICEEERDVVVESTKNYRRYQDQQESSSKGTDGKKSSLPQSILEGLPFVVELFRARQKLPPLQVDDANLLLYDVFLMVNLSMSISFWVTHRMNFEYLPSAFSEGCLLSIFWILSGLYNGMFLYSAVDGHYGTSDDRGGPKAAALLALNTYVNTVNLRLLFALIVAVAEHRQVGVSPSEQILPLEIGFGLLLMSSWRALHSSMTPRI